MLVTFSTKAYADITMFGEAAQTVLAAMGHSGTVPGAILAADLPLALDRLTAAIAAEIPRPKSDDDDAAQSLAQQSFVLRQLLQAAITAQTNVMWK